MTMTHPLAAVVWPAPRKGAVLRLLAECGALPRAALRAPAAGAERLIVAVAPFSEAVVPAFDEAVAEGRAEDSAEGFRRFASTFFGKLHVFRNRWLTEAAEPARLVVPLADLRADPVLWIGRILDFARPDLPAEDAARAKAVARARALLAADAAPGPAAFRYHDAALFDLLDRLALTREQVETLFRKTLGRAPAEAALLRFQALPSLADLRRALTASGEARQARGGGPEHPAFAEAPPALIRTEAYLRWSQKQKTRLGWPLAQVFVSRRSRVLYCPIGKVACTFLKQQMVRISDVAHPDLILSDISRLTDHIPTGLQLSDYPEAEARAMMADPAMWRVAVLRNPADRLLSAYVEKFVIGRNHPANIFHTRKVVAAAQGRETPDIDGGISFRAFLETIAAAPPETLDPHWRPQAHYLTGMVYDRLFALEQIGAVVDELEARSGCVLPRQAQNVTDSGAGAAWAGAADLLPAQILARSRIGKASFLEPGLLELIDVHFAEDAALHRRALAAGPAGLDPSVPEAADKGDAT